MEQAAEGIIQKSLRPDSVKKFPIVGIISKSILKNIKYYLSKEIVSQVEGRKPELLDRFHGMVNVRDLRYIELVGAVLGFIIGCLQVIVLNLF